MPERIVYLMRGLPSCGKSHLAARLIRDGGVSLETDQYFFTEVGTDPTKFDYRADLLDAARDWNFRRFVEAVAAGVSPIVVDRGNSRSIESKHYIQHAYAHGYQVELKEPDSEWWQEIRVLLKYKQYTKPVLYQWADRLAEMNRRTHRTPVATIRHWMDRWKWDLTIEDILKVKE
jgi:hypothetical protein